jgi:rhamnosyltransferase
MEDLIGTSVLFSIVIPVKNGDLWLTRLLDALVRQTLFQQSEIIVIDSGSTDRSLEIIGGYPVTLIKIPPEQFNHGLTRNLGVREAKGDFVVMTVQDAVPESDQWLERLLQGFANEKVVAVCGQQVVPHERDKNPVLWFRPVSAHRTWYIQYERPDEFFRLSPAKQREMAGWDNVTAAYRRKTLLEFPFARVDFGEDISWAKAMILKGFTLGHADSAMVYHYHHQLPNFILPRYFSLYYFEYQLFGLKPSLSHSVLYEVALAARILSNEKKLSWMEKARWLTFNFRYWWVLRSTIRNFNSAVAQGGKELDTLYFRICKSPPQALKY